MPNKKGSPNDKALLIAIQGWTAGYKLQEKNAEGIHVGLVVYYSVHEILGSKVPTIYFFSRLFVMN